MNFQTDDFRHKSWAHIRHWRSQVKHFVDKVNQDMLFANASALVYTTLLSIVPIMAVAFFLFNAFGGMDTIVDKIKPMIEENLAPSFGEKIFEYLDAFQKNINSGAVGIFGLIGFIFTSVATLGTIERTFNIIWGVRRRRTISQRITTYWTLLTIGPLLLGASVAITAKAMSWLHQDSGKIATALIYASQVLPYAASSLLFGSLYFFVPNIAVPKRDAARAGILTGIIFEIAKVIYAKYATNTLATASIYGSLSIFPVFLLWIFVVWLIILLGAEICCLLQFKRLKVPFHFSIEQQINPFIVADILEELSVASHELNGGVKQSTLLADLRLPTNELETHLHFLEEKGWIVCGYSDLFGEKKYHIGVSSEILDMRRILNQTEDYRYTPRCPHGILVHKKFKELWGNWTVTPGRKDRNEK